MPENGPSSDGLAVGEALDEAARSLSECSLTPRLDGELLMAHAIGTTREAMLLHHRRSPAPRAFWTLVERRRANEPVAYILGRRAFWTIELEVGPGTLVPRPDSETLIEAAVAHFPDGGPARILDLGTGPGTLLLAALDQWPEATGLGIDRSETALSYARRNARRLGLSSRAELRQGDWASGVEERFELVLCNPPYVESEAPLAPDVRDWEPGEALFAGEDGLDDYRRLAPQLRRLIAPGGVACVEIGHGQEPAVCELMTAHGLNVSVRRDLAGIARCLTLVLDRD